MYINYEKPIGGSPTSTKICVYKLCKVIFKNLYLTLLIPSQVMRFRLEYNNFALLHSKDN